MASIFDLTRLELHVWKWNNILQIFFTDEYNDDFSMSSHALRSSSFEQHCSEIASSQINQRGQFAKSSITQPCIAWLSWNLMWQWTMDSGGWWNIKIHFWSKPRWLTVGQKCKIWPCFGPHSPSSHLLFQMKQCIDTKVSARMEWRLTPLSSPNLVLSPCPSEK